MYVKILFIQSLSTHGILTKTLNSYWKNFIGLFCSEYRRQTYIYKKKLFPNTVQMYFPLILWCLWKYERSEEFDNYSPKHGNCPTSEETGPHIINHKTYEATEMLRR